MGRYCQAIGCTSKQDCQIVLDYHDSHLRGYYCMNHAIKQLDYYKSIIAENADN